MHIDLIREDIMKYLVSIRQKIVNKPLQVYGLTESVRRRRFENVLRIPNSDETEFIHWFYEL